MPDRQRLKILEKVPPPINPSKPPLRSPRSPHLIRGPETLHNSIVYGEYGVQVSNTGYNSKVACVSNIWNVVENIFKDCCSFEIIMFWGKKKKTELCWYRNSLRKVFYKCNHQLITPQFCEIYLIVFFLSIFFIFCLLSQSKQAYFQSNHFQACPSMILLWKLFARFAWTYAPLKHYC